MKSQVNTMAASQTVLKDLVPKEEDLPEVVVPETQPTPYNASLQSTVDPLAPSACMLRRLGSLSLPELSNSCSDRCLEPMPTMLYMHQ